MWFQRQAPQGMFLPAVPQFCSYDQGEQLDDCDTALWNPGFSNPSDQFKGEVTLLVNENCISSCDGFVWMMVTKLRARLVGLPQAADTAFSRLELVLSYKDQEWQFDIRPQHGPLGPQDLASWGVVVTQSTDQSGMPVSGTPFPVDIFVPRYFDDTPLTYVHRAGQRLIKPNGANL